MGKREDTGYQHFLRFLTMYSKGSLFSVVKSRDCVVNILKGKRNTQIYTGYLKFIYVSKMNSFSRCKSTNIYKIKSGTQTADSFDSTIDFPSLLM